MLKDFSICGSAVHSIRKSVNEDPLLLHTNTKTKASTAFENSSLPAVKKGGATENSTKEAKSLISGTETIYMGYKETLPNGGTIECNTTIKLRGKKHKSMDSQHTCRTSIRVGS